MLSDIVKFTKIIFDEALIDDKTLSSAKAVYDLYRDLANLISNAGLVANHYLALDFTEGYLQYSSWGEPVDKWRKFFNEDLKGLDKASKKYLHGLHGLSFDGMFEALVSNHYNCKTYYGFVRDQYNAGFVEPCGKMLYITALKTDVRDNEDYYLQKHIKIDLSTYESRLKLKQELNQKIDTLKTEHQRLKSYIQSRYTLDNLL